MQDYQFKNADGSNIHFSLDHVKDGDIVTVKGKGVPYNANGDVCGDLVLKVKVLLPTNLSESKKQRIQKILPDDVNEYE